MALPLCNYVYINYSISVEFILAIIVGIAVDSEPAIQH